MPAGQLRPYLQGSCRYYEPRSSTNRHFAMETLDRIAPHAHWLLRFSLASVFLYHGITKFPMLGMLAYMMGMPVAMVGMLG